MLIIYTVSCLLPPLLKTKKGILGFWDSLS